jgi:hypothetical protein
VEICGSASRQAKAYRTLKIMPVVKKRNQQTETRLLLESRDPIDLPPASVEESAVLVQFDDFKPWIPELLHVLRSGTVADPIPIMLDGSTFAIHGQLRTYWVKIWHAAGSNLTQIDRVQVISCLPSTRGVQVLVDMPDKFESYSSQEQTELESPDESE